MGGGWGGGVPGLGEGGGDRVAPEKTRGVGEGRKGGFNASRLRYVLCG